MAEGSGEERLDAEAFNLACFRLTRALEELELCVPEARPLARSLLRTVGRIVIDTGGPGADPSGWANTEEMALLWIDQALRPHGYQVRPAPGSGRGELSQTANDWS